MTPVIKSILVMALATLAVTGTDRTAYADGYDDLAQRLNKIRTDAWERAVKLRNVCTYGTRIPGVEVDCVTLNGSVREGAESYFFRGGAPVKGTSTNGSTVHTYIFPDAGTHIMTVDIVSATGHITISTDLATPGNSRFTKVQLPAMTQAQSGRGYYPYSASETLTVANVIGRRLATRGNINLVVYANTLLGDPYGTEHLLQQAPEILNGGEQ